LINHSQAELDVFGPSVWQRRRIRDSEEKRQMARAIPFGEYQNSPAQKVSENARITWQHDEHAIIKKQRKNRKIKSEKI